MMKKIREDHIQTALNKVLDLFKTGDVPSAISRVIFPPYKELPSNSWSLLNRIIMMTSDTSDGRGIKMWNEAGRKVVKGSKAFYILAPKMRKKKKDSDEKEDHFLLAGFL